MSAEKNMILSRVLGDQASTVMAKMHYHPLISLLTAEQINQYIKGAIIEAVNEGHLSPNENGFAPGDMVTWREGMRAGPVVAMWVFRVLDPDCPLDREMVSAMLRDVSVRVRGTPYPDALVVIPDQDLDMTEPSLVSTSRLRFVQKEEQNELVKAMITYRS